MNTIDIHVHYTGQLEHADAFVSAWRQAGIDRAVVFGLSDSQGRHVSPAEVADLSRRYPDFVIPFGYLALGHHDCLGEVRQAIDLGFKGLKFIFPAKPYDDDEYFPIYELAASAGMVCLFHTGIVIGTARGADRWAFQRTWRVSSNYMRPACLDRIARCFPDMTIIGAHLGGGAWYEEAMEMMAWNANVHFDLSIGQIHYERRRGVPEGQERRAVRPRLKELYDEGLLNLDKILFGSDGVMGEPDPSPGWAMRTLQFELDALGATEDEKQAVRWRTAAKLLGLCP